MFTQHKKQNTYHYRAIIYVVDLHLLVLKCLIVRHVYIKALLFIPQSSVLQKVCVSRQQVQVELLEREEVERELGLVKGWIQDTQGLLLSPTADLDTLLSDLEVKWS